MKQLMFSILFIIGFAVYAIAQNSQTVNNGFSVERELGEMDKHYYEVNLAKGQMLNFVVEQRGIDIILRIYTADGKFHDRVDSPNGNSGDEPFKMVSPNGGRYRVEVNHFNESDAAGKYFIKPVEIRKATEAELKAARLRDELLKIVAEDNRSGSYPDALKRYFMERALFTTAGGYVSNAAEMIELTTKMPFKLPANASDEIELSDVKMEDFGDSVMMSVYRSRHYKIPSENIDRTVNQRVGYVFKRTNGEWRVANVQGTFIGREPKPIKLDAKQFDALVGVYQGGKPSETLTVTREAARLFGKFPEGERFALIPETENTFFADFVGIAFIRDSNGAAAQAVVHYSLPDDRLVVQQKVK